MSKADGWDAIAGSPLAREEMGRNSESGADFSGRVGGLLRAWTGDLR